MASPSITLETFPPVSPTTTVSKTYTLFQYFKPNIIDQVGSHELFGLGIRGFSFNQRQSSLIPHRCYCLYSTFDFYVTGHSNGHPQPRFQRVVLNQPDAHWLAPEHDVARYRYLTSSLLLCF
ncbi:hypothetical protein QN277_007759 [Acacia crassicarpa]|uniref:Uncharacterized protein n=1 Tax=Acacia crassicarpa TaxID=499986 RepID=A0AAE1IXQ0_9FABA|nr:hypothetical protein QN277_007759 [Acacia crassicarpa]